MIKVNTNFINFWFFINLINSDNIEGKRILPFYYNNNPPIKEKTKPDRKESKKPSKNYTFIFS